jgi:WhiB family transcriptional regulator, redox-sensing transcriptional regulator
MRFSDTPACAGIDTEIFFTEEKGNYTNLDFIKRMCDTCPVRVECFDYAVEHLVHGIWAGTSKEERDKYRRKHNIEGKTVVPISIFNSNYDS